MVAELDEDGVAQVLCGGHGGSRGAAHLQKGGPAK